MEQKIDLNQLLTLKNDLSQGATMSMEILTDQVDMMAIQTISNSPPPFLFPFQYRMVDENMELLYSMQHSTKLCYAKEEKDIFSYVEFWNQLLTPLIICDDWFMDAFSFILDINYLYLKKDTKEIQFFYLPQKNSCGSMEDLQELMIQVSKIITPADKNLADKVEKTLTSANAFDLQSFLTMLKGHRGDSSPKISEMNVVSTVFEEINQPTIPEPTLPMVKQVSEENFSDDIVFASQTEIPVKKGLFSKKDKGNKEKKGFFSFGEKNESKVVGGIPDFNFEEIALSSEEDGGTLLSDEEILNGCPILRKVGTATTPIQIPLQIMEGIPYLIGRFNVRSGEKQCDFEFDKATKGVSRKHCAFERVGEEYRIIDLGSKVGTMLNGQIIDSQIPTTLREGDTVSFGNDGVDYVFEF